jgi:hypothetical protein
MDRDHRSVILDLFGKVVRQTRESAHPHTHSEIVALYETSADMIRVRISAHYQVGGYFETEALPGGSFVFNASELLGYAVP